MAFSQRRTFSDDRMINMISNQREREAYFASLPKPAVNPGELQRERCAIQSMRLRQERTAQAKRVPIFDRFKGKEITIGQRAQAIEQANQSRLDQFWKGAFANV